MAKKKVKKQEKNRFEEGIENFAEEVGSVGKRVGNRLDHGTRHHRERYNRAFGPFSPFLTSIFNILILGIILWIIDFFSLTATSPFFFALYTFISANLGIFFAASLFFSYSDYLSKRHSWFKLVSPIIVAAGVVFAFWLIGFILLIIGTSLNFPMFNPIANYMILSYLWLFGLVVFIGYVVLVLKLIFDKSTENKERVEVKKTKSKSAKVKRIYRSGEEKIIGGVCGGIAEYLGIDPVLIRLLWVAGALAYGSGIMLYIIAWIIIPRNPKHKW